MPLYYDLIQEDQCHTLVRRGSEYGPCISTTADGVRELSRTQDTKVVETREPLCYSGKLINNWGVTGAAGSGMRGHGDIASLDVVPEVSLHKQVRGGQGSGHPCAHVGR